MRRKAVSKIILMMLLTSTLTTELKIGVHANAKFLTMYQPLASQKAEPFGLVNVTLVVRDYDGTPLKDAEVKAFSEDWGIKYPDWFGYTDVNGHYKFEIPVGNWSFFAGGGWTYSLIHPGHGYFGVLQYIEVVENSILTIQPDESITLEVFDIDGLPLDVEVRIMEDNHVPIVIAPLAGKTNNGGINIHVTRGMTYDMLLYGFPLKSGYIFHQENVPSNSTLVVKPAIQDVAHIFFEAYDPNFNPTSGLWAYVNFHRFSVGEHTGLQPVNFAIDGNREVYASPGLVKIGFWFGIGGWHYSFIGEDYTLTPFSELTLKFGGPLEVGIHVLRKDTQIWIDVKDSFGNIMNFFNDAAGQTYVPIKLTKDGTIIYQGDIAEKVGAWNALLAGKIDQTFDIGDSPEYEILLDLGFFGTFNLTGTLLSNPTLLKYETINTTHFTVNAPEGFSEKFGKMAQLFERAYDVEGEAVQENLTERTNVTFYINYIAAGFAGRNRIGMGIGFSLDSSLSTIPSTFIGVAFHELGHVFQLSPPLGNYYITFHFGEPFATLLANEAITKIFGHKLGLLDQGTHREFFRYLKTRDNINLVENIQFVLFYLRKHWGINIHQQFVHLWANETLAAKKQLLASSGFNTDEMIAILYSFLADKNLGWLFRLAGLDISGERVAQGLILLGALWHDVGIRSLIKSKTTVGQGYSVSFRIELLNYGTFAEQFNVTISVNTTTIETKEVTLTSGNSTTLMFTWNTTGFAKGNYTISAYAWPVPSETDMTDNTYIDGNVIVAMIGDITGPLGVPDGKVDIRDIATVAKLFGVNYPDPRYNPNCDIHYDRKIDIRDIAIAAIQFGKIDP